MIKSKKNIILLCTIIISVLLVLVLGTIFDLQISKLLADLPNGQYYTDNIFAIIGETIGEDILYFLVISACAILFYCLVYNKFKNKWLNYILQAILVLISYLVGIYLFYVTLDNFAPYVSGVSEYISSTVGIITIFLFPIIIVGLIYLLFSKTKPEKINALWKWALIVLIVAVVSNAIVQVSKHIFDRTRFRAMVFSGDDKFSYFTNWFTINTNKFQTNSMYAGDFFKSFPSGHTCAATSIFLIVLLPVYLQDFNNKQTKITLWIVASVYTLFVALSRIVAGAHFFTDVYIAFLITALTILITFVIINKTSNKLQTYVSKSLQNNNENASYEATQQEQDLPNKEPNKQINNTKVESKNSNNLKNDSSTQEQIMNNEHKKKNN